MKEQLEQILTQFAASLQAAGVSDYEETYAGLADSVSRETYDLMVQILEKRGAIKRQGGALLWVGKSR
jgi:hypothetical protein